VPRSQVPAQGGGWSAGLLSVQQELAALDGAREVLRSTRCKTELAKSKSERSRCAGASSASLGNLCLQHQSHSSMQGCVNHSVNHHRRARGGCGGL